MDFTTRLRYQSKFFFLHKDKEYFTEKFIPLLKKLNTMKNNTKTILYNKAGEKKNLGENYAKLLEYIYFESKSTGNPQKNCVIEQVFATLYSWTCAMMEHTGLH